MAASRSRFNSTSGDVSLLVCTDSILNSFSGSRDSVFESDYSYDPQQEGEDKDKIRPILAHRRNKSGSRSIKGSLSLSHSTLETESFVEELEKYVKEMARTDNSSVDDAWAQLHQKEADLLLAAELGNALLEKNQELEKEQKKLVDQFSTKLESSKKKKDGEEISPPKLPLQLDLMLPKPSIFKMPNASELALRRREKDKKATHISSVALTPKSKNTKSPRKKHLNEKEKPLPELPLYLTSIIPKPSKCKMPDASKLAARRKIKEEKDKLLPDLTPYLNLNSLNETNQGKLDETNMLKLLESELSLNMNNYCVKKSESKISFVNPGIDINTVQLPLTIKISTNYLAFLMPIIKEINEQKDSDNLNDLLNIILEIIEEHDCKSESEILIFFLSLCLVFLDKNCRLIPTMLDKQQVFHHFVRKNTDSLLNMFDMLVDIVMDTFTHFHDRLYLVECLESVKVNPLKISTDPLYLSNRLSKHILIRSLCDLIDYDLKESIDKINTFKRLNKMLLKGKKTKSLDLYTVYILIKMLNKLNTMMAYKDHSEMINDRKGKNWLLSFFTNLIGHQTYESTLTEEYFIIKHLCACTTYLWKENVTETEKILV